MDALTDILKTVSLQGSVFCRSELTAPWGIAFSAGDAAQFHVVRRGRCWLSVDETGHVDPPLRLDAGDLVMLPKGQAHVMRDDPRTPPTPLMQLLRRDSPDSCGPLVFGGGGESVTLVCGYFRFLSGVVHPLLSILPSVVVLRGEGGRARSWLESTLGLMAEEAVAARPGREKLIDRLTEVLFIQVLREHLEEQGATAPSWLAALKDEQMAAALGMMHRQPDLPWTIQELASRVAMSRSAFCTRFRELVGEPPLQYLTRWRMEVAASHLREARLTLPEISTRVGYQAEAAFSKVFKRLWGMAPGQYRRELSGTMRP
jgi:AraC family transcriptional regulator, alkane utilization regulator